MLKAQCDARFLDIPSYQVLSYVNSHTVNRNMRRTLKQFRVNPKVPLAGVVTGTVIKGWHTGIL